MPSKPCLFLGLRCVCGIIESEPSLRHSFFSAAPEVVFLFNFTSSATSFLTTSLLLLAPRSIFSFGISFDQFDPCNFLSFSFVFSFSVLRRLFIPCCDHRKETDVHVLLKNTHRPDYRLQSTDLIHNECECFLSVVVFDFFSSRSG